jgi:hypothetical protein
MSSVLLGNGQTIAGAPGQSLTVQADGSLAFSTGALVSNANLYWVTAAPVNPAPFTVLEGDGKITGAMFSYTGIGQYVLDLSSLLATGIFAAFVTSVTPYNNGGGDTFALANGTFSGNFLLGSPKVGLQFYRWTGSTYALQDREFSLLILAK